MKKKIQNVVKFISVMFAIIGILIIVYAIAFSMGYFPYILGIAFIVAGFLAYKTGMGHLDNIFGDK
jgi:uncharacterized membrane protein